MKPLKYTDYKIKQALWLQIQDNLRTNRGHSLEQFCIEKYLYYLSLCGKYDDLIFKAIRSVQMRINYWNWNMKPDPMFDADIESEVGKIVDYLSLKIK